MKRSSLWRVVPMQLPAIVALAAGVAFTPGTADHTGVVRAQPGVSAPELVALCRRCDRHTPPYVDADAVQVGPEALAGCEGWCVSEPSMGNGEGWDPAFDWPL